MCWLRTATKFENKEPQQRFRFVLDLIVASTAFTFAFWTIASHVSVVLHLPFRILADTVPLLVLVGVLLGVIASRAIPPDSAFEPEKPGVQSDWILVVVAAAVVTARVIGVSYQVFWIAAVALLSAGFARTANKFSARDKGPPAPLTPAGKAALALIMLASPVVTYISHAPNVDDAEYVGTAADAVAHPDLPVLSHDAAYGDLKLPVMLPSYAVESYELLVGAIARWLKLEPILLAHALFPTAMALLVPIAWAGLMRILVPRYWLPATVLALIALNVPADPKGFGFFGFVGLFVGKAILVSIGIPLVFTYAWRFEESGAVWEWLILTALVIGCVGLSASAIFVVPIGLTLAAVAGWRKGLTERATLVVLPSLYLLMCGLSISQRFNALERAFVYLPARAALAVTMVFGERTENLVLFALLAAPFLVRRGALQRRLLLLVLGYFVVALNPFTFKFLSRFTTRDAAWRLLWCIPVAAVVAAGIVGAIQAIGDHLNKWAAIVAAVLLAAGTVPLARNSILARATHSLKPLRVLMPDYAIARQAIAAAPPNSTLLAPDTVAVWVPTFVDRPPLVGLRDLYDDEMGVHMSSEDLHTRRDLRKLVSGTKFSSPRSEELLNALATYRVGLIVVTEAAADQLEAELSMNGYSPVGKAEHYVFFRRSF